MTIPTYFIWHIITGHYKSINKLYDAAKNFNDLRISDLVFMHVDYMNKVIVSKFYYVLFKYLGVKRVFGVARTTFVSGSIAAHNLNIPVFEFQHGITFGETEYYSGPRCDAIDPDFFLSFGDMWKGTQFGIDPNSIINIGWAYKEEINSKSNYLQDSVIIISSPEISNQMLQVASELAQIYSNYTFYIRCHPYEKYDKKQNMIVESIENLCMDDNSIDSAKALCHYEFVIGSNSSVVYEALNMGKKVGRICYNGIECSNDGADDGFFYLRDSKDFAKFVASDTIKQHVQAYSDFNKEIIDSLPIKN